MHQEVSALQQRIFSPRISLGKDFNGCSLLVEPARHSDVGSQVFGDLAPNRKEHPLEIVVNRFSKLQSLLSRFARSDIVGLSLLFPNSVEGVKDRKFNYSVVPENSCVASQHLDVSNCHRVILIHHCSKQENRKNVWLEKTQKKSPKFLAWKKTEAAVLCAASNPDATTIACLSVTNIKKVAVPKFFD